VRRATRHAAVAPPRAAAAAGSGGREDAPWLQDLSAELVIPDEALEVRAVTLLCVRCACMQLTLSRRETPPPTDPTQARAAARARRDGGLMPRLLTPLLMVRLRRASHTSSVASLNADASSRFLAPPGSVFCRRRAAALLRARRAERAVRHAAAGAAVHAGSVRGGLGGACLLLRVALHSAL
jgi:hypothetical protein